MLHLNTDSIYHQKSNIQLQGYVDAVPLQYNEDLKQLIQRINHICDVSSVLGVIVCRIDSIKLIIIFIFFTYYSFDYY